MVRTAVKTLSVAGLLLAAFYLAGFAALTCEAWHNNILLSCGIFTGTFSSVIAGAMKVYHILFA